MIIIISLLKTCVDVFTDRAKAMVGKTTGALVPSSQRYQTVLRVVVLFINTHLKKAKQNSILLEESESGINFIKSPPSNTGLFNILRDKIGSMQKVLLQKKSMRVVPKKLTCSVELQTELAAFFMEVRFDLKE